MKSQRLVVVLCIATALALILVACASTSPTSAPPAPPPTTAPTAPPAAQPQASPTSAQAAQPSAQPKRGGTLTIARPASPNTMETQVDAGLEGNIILFQVCEGLYDFDAEGNVIPALATGYTVSSDGLKWTFKLRQGIKFSNGDSFTSKDVKYTFTRLTHPSSPASFKERFLEFMKKPWEDGVETPDDYTVVFNLTRPNPTFLFYMARTTDPLIISERGVVDGGKDFGYKAFPICTGPFMVKEWVKDDHVTIVKNPNHWQNAPDGKPLPYLDQIVFKVVPEPSTRLLQIQNKQIDVDMDPSAKDAVALMKDPNVVVQHSGGHTTALIGFNTKVAPFNDVRLRQAFSYGIDRKKIADVLFYGFAEPAADLFQSMDKSINWAHDPSAPVPYWPDKAKNLLKEAGYSPEKPLQTTLMTYNVAPFVDVATMAQAQLADVGIKLNLMPLALTTMVDYQRGRQGKDPNEFKAALSRLGTKDSTVDFYQRYLDPTGSQNVFGYNLPGGAQNPEADKLIKAAGVLSDYVPEDQAKLKEIFKQLNALWINDAPFINVVYVQNIDVLQKYVKGRTLIGVEHGKWTWTWLDK